jgi:serine/threonine-protein kinase RsbW
MLILDTQKIKFPSKPESQSIVERFIDDLCDYFNVNNDYYGNILVAVLEAVENAINHGNQKNTEKSVILSFEAKNDSFSFTIEDEGNGFDFNNIPDPTDPANEDINRGRGIFLMKHLADEVKFLNNGNTIELDFKIANINNKVANHRIEEFLKHQSEKSTINKKEGKLL